MVSGPIGRSRTVATLPVEDNSPLVQTRGECCLPSEVNAMNANILRSHVIHTQMIPML